MNASNPSLNEQLAALAPDGWSWKPSDPPALIFQDLWLSTKWVDVPRLIDELFPALLILKDPASPPRRVNSEIEKTVQILCNIRSIVYLPDIASLVTAIDNENRSKPPEQMCNIDEDNERRSSTRSGLSIVNGTEPKSPLDQLCYDVESSSCAITDNSTCSDCKKKLSLFVFGRRYHCRMCGQTQCSDCQIWQTCRHLGYTLPVRICQACSLHKRGIIIDAIYSHIQKSLINGSTQYLSLYIALLKHYSQQNDFLYSLYELVENHFLAFQNFGGVMQCLAYRCAPHEA
ncbi:unnamed protein product [Didymodactylos carnosus]|uniref:FYVE-type domain-containing protein n=1 Tax=Didymodactylos carnosus TaxID=1234261 RepID=A0A8S2E2R1_9BILA|nr:unnamed protein product [Didymodactylos carnosus]CAF3817627.1 unnamed protein product [Didymodactylos carnosus]